MKRAWLIATSVVRWLILLPAFALIVPPLLVVVMILGQRRTDWMLPLLGRLVTLIGGAWITTKRAPGYDKNRVCFYVANHVNLFDPFVLYPAVPAFFRGLELESHFKIPVYGWMMRTFGNVPVPDVRTAAGLKKTYRLAEERLQSGTSLMVFPEGSRTLDGRVGKFELGVFRMALQLGYPIVPVSVVDSFRWKRKGSYLLRPTRVTVVIHDVIETEGLGRRDMRALRERVHEAISGPVHASLDARPVEGLSPPESSS